MTENEKLLKASEEGNLEMSEEQRKFKVYKFCKHETNGRSQYIPI